MNPSLTLEGRGMVPQGCVKQLTEEQLTETYRLRDEPSYANVVSTIWRWLRTQAGA